MFKVPDWDDSSIRNDSFINLSPNRNKKKSKIPPEKPKLNVNSKTIFNVQNKVSANLKGKCVLKPKTKRIVITSRENHKPSKGKGNKRNEQNVDKSIRLVKNNKRKTNDMNRQIKNYDTDKLDELILNERRQKIEEYKNDDNEEDLFKEIHRNVKTNTTNTREPDAISKIALEEELRISQNNGNKQIALKIDASNPTHPAVTDFKNNVIKTKKSHKKQIIKQLLLNDNYRNHISVTNGSKLRDRMMERLKAAKFRYLNEKLYTSRGSDAQKLFLEDPTAFKTYHEGYQQQVKRWPVKPLDVIIERIKKMPKSYKIADMGCGEAELARRVAQTVRSFDLVGSSLVGSPAVEACDMAHTPLGAGAVDAAVYCLALMGTDLTQYLLEANRVLRVAGHLLIAEVESRFDNVEAFTKDVQKLGFSLKKLDKTQKVFFFMEFVKVRDPPVKKSKLPTLTLQPCLYKKR